MKSVYIVTSGFYSDYGINCAFTDRDVAQRYCDVWNAAEKSEYSCRDVEEYDLDLPANVKLATSGKLWWTVTFYPKGTYRQDDSWWARPEFAEPKDKNDQLSDKGQFMTRVYCKKEETALKVAQERLMRHRARLEGMG